MNKGILIIDKIPEYCDEHCKFCDSFFNCQYVGDVEEAWRNKQRDPKCPIKPLPQKIEVDVKKVEDIMHTEFQMVNVFQDKIIADIKLETDKLIALGWNKCIDKILGEE